MSPTYGPGLTEVTGRAGAPAGRAGRPAGGPAGGPVTFKAGCPDCGARFELPSGALRLAIGSSPRTTFYSFTCPECGAAVRKPAGERIVELLTGGGVSTLRSL
ncbi:MULTISPECIES: phage terminase large subunit family protein [unclassified Streptomyces]|uniref:phage terminase large subunit family protein n=1 Tax=unclassified Streptomyces TaxID=2593676 RepID=UPI001BEB3DFA|nr:MULTISPECIES: phage terminase large subunit family protein [unclassified Streptomyces]MBT2403733.1 hypothetical protein [Streptomyces sp. ISL-21]MBT2611210.1 hypothetical protein [Streptomyces sp. ISL-87]